MTVCNWSYAKSKIKHNVILTLYVNRKHDFFAIKGKSTITKSFKLFLICTFCVCSKRTVFVNHPYFLSLNQLSHIHPTTMLRLILAVFVAVILNQASAQSVDKFDRTPNTSQFNGLLQYLTSGVPTPEECAGHCLNDPKCKSFSFTVKFGGRCIISSIDTKLTPPSSSSTYDYYERPTAKSLDKFDRTPNANQFNGLVQYLTNVATPEECAGLCLNNQRCKSFTFRSDKRCVLSSFDSSVAPPLLGGPYDYYEYPAAKKVSGMCLNMYVYP